MEPNPYYPQQMNGPVISAFGAGVTQEMANATIIAEYLYNLSMNTAQETELENIGRIIGYPRPLVPDGFEDENLFLFGEEPITQDALIGFGTIDSAVGGQLSTVQTTSGNKMQLGSYRQMLEKMAYMKRYGLTLSVLDKIARGIDSAYTISYNDDHDIVITFDNPIGYKNVYILTQLFYRVATEPQIIIVSGNGN